MTTLLLLIWATALPSQWTADCQDKNPRLERLGSAIQRGEIEFIQASLDGGGDVEEIWRDTPFQVCRSLLLRSLWYGQEEIFHLLLKRGADPLKLPRDSLQIPVREGRLELVRTLFGLGLTLHDEAAFDPHGILNHEVLLAGLESKSIPMLELLLSSGIRVDAWTFPSYYLSDDVTRFLVPERLHPSDRVILASHCEFEEVFGVLEKDQDHCADVIGPLWFHFVWTRNYEMVEFMIEKGADLTLHGEGDVGRFTASELASKQKDKRMIALLRRAGAPRQ